MNVRDRSVIVAARLVSATIIVTSLKYGQSLFVPIALSIILSFLLSPLVTALERRGCPRYPTVYASVLSVLVLIVSLGGIVVNEVSRLATETPHVRENLTRRFSSVAEGFEQTISRVERFFPLHPHTDRSTSTTASEKLQHSTPAQSAEAIRESTQAAAAAPQMISPIAVISYLGVAVAELVAFVLVVMVLSSSLLVYREDMRDRLLQLFGERRMILTTQALNDAVNGVRRYLLLNLAVNTLYGLMLSGLLFALSIPSPLLWGSLAVFFRFLPHIGVYIALMPPLLCALSIDPGYTSALSVVGVGIALDATLSNFIEPYIYGRRIGVSAMALVLSALFWIWCWGPIGLVVATPFAVWIVVIGRYVPGFESLSILFSDDGGLETAFKLYHRLLAGEELGARRVLAEEAGSLPPADVWDAVLIPQLMLAEADAQRHLLTDETYREILRLVTLLGAGTIAGQDEPTMQLPLRIQIVSIRLQSERVIAEFLARDLERRGAEVQVISPTALSSEAVQEIQTFVPSVVILVSLADYSAQGVKYLLKRLARAYEKAPVVALLLGGQPSDAPQTGIPTQAPLLRVKRYSETIAAVESLVGLCPPREVQRTG